MVILNKTCRFCPHCDLLIAHKDEVELHLAQLRAQMGPGVIGNDYLIVGTVERNDWRRCLAKPLTPVEMIEASFSRQARMGTGFVLPTVAEQGGRSGGRMLGQKFFCQDFRSARGKRQTGRDCKTRGVPCCCHACPPNPHLDKQSRGWYFVATIRGRAADCTGKSVGQRGSPRRVAIC